MFYNKYVPQFLLFSSKGNNYDMTNDAMYRGVHSIMPPFQQEKVEMFQVYNLVFVSYICVPLCLEIP